MTRAASLRRLAIWGGVVVVATVVLYVPTLTGGSPWSWHVAELDVRILMGLSALGGALWAHWFWPTTEDWPALEWLCAHLVIEWRGGAPPDTHDMECVEGLVRPHVLERARRGR